MPHIEKYEHAKFIISRYDHYFDSINNKGAFYIGVNTFLLGGLFTGFVTLHEKISKPSYLWWLMIIFACCSVISSIITIFAIQPYANKVKKSAQRSLMYFASVASYDQENFCEAFRQQDEERINKDTLSQLWRLAAGLTLKFRRLRYAGYLLLVQFILLFPIVYCITKNIITNEHP